MVPLRLVGLWTRADKGTLLAAENIPAGARVIARTFDGTHETERTICSDVVVAPDGGALTPTMPPHGFALVWLK